MGLSQEDIQASMRISFGWQTQEADVLALLDALVLRVQHLRRMQEGQAYAA
jgi:cysteine sulfinate desulfinase/cysteine desulfurase-like protein